MASIGSRTNSAGNPATRINRPLGRASQPRLDWQMWFAALGTYRQNPWFVGLTRQLLENNPNVTQLLAHNPFPDKPPLYIRSMLYDYHFTTLTEHRASGAWWKREERGEYLPPVSLRNFGN